MWTVPAPVPIWMPVPELLSNTPLPRTLPRMIRPKALAPEPTAPRCTSRPSAPTNSAGAWPKVVIEPAASSESTMPSPSASVVVSVATVVAGGAPTNTPPPTLARI